MAGLLTLTQRAVSDEVSLGMDGLPSLPNLD